MELNVVVEQQAFGGYLLPRSAEVLLTPGLLAALQDRLRRAQVDSHWDVLDAALHLFERALSSSVRRFYAADGPPLLELVADAEELDQLDRRLEQKLRSLPLRHAPTPLPPTPPRAIPRTESPPRPTPPSVRRSTARRVVTPPVLSNIDGPLAFLDDPAGASERLAAMGLEVIDMRSRGGCLWVVGGPELRSAVALGGGPHLRFTFSPKGGKATRHRPSWFARGLSDRPSPESSSSLQRPVLPNTAMPAGSHADVPRIALCHQCKQRLADAVYGSHSTLKSCPPCSKRLGMHAFYPLKLFGLRRVGGKDILQSWCAACRAERRPPTPTAWCAGLQTR